MHKLPAEQLEQLVSTIRDSGRLPSPFNAYRTTLRLAPSFARCYTLHAAPTRLGSAELNGLAEHWAKTLMGQQWNEWQWQALQVEIQHPVLLFAFKVDEQHLNVFQAVKPELMYLIDTLQTHESAWVVCNDEALVQSALVLEGNIASIRTWPSHYTSHVKDVIDKHLLICDAARGANVHKVLESRFGEVIHHGTP